MQAADDHTVSSRPRARRRLAPVVAVAVAAGAGCLLAPSAALAQLRRMPDHVRLERVDSAVEDVGPLNSSARQAPVDLRVPDDFEGVYRLRGANGRDGSDLYIRISGGVIAVFPQSVYTPMRSGLHTHIPPGTVFYLGGLPESLLSGPAEEPLPLAPNRVSTRLTTHHGPPEGAGGGAGGPVDTSVTNARPPWRAPEPEPAMRGAGSLDEHAARAGRVRGLLMQAAGAAGRRTPHADSDGREAPPVEPRHAAESAAPEGADVGTDVPTPTDR